MTENFTFNAVYFARYVIAVLYSIQPTFTSLLGSNSTILDAARTRRIARPKRLRPDPKVAPRWHRQLRPPYLVWSTPGLQPPRIFDGRFCRCHGYTRHRDHHEERFHEIEDPLLLHSRHPALPSRQGYHSKSSRTLSEPEFFIIFHPPAYADDIGRQWTLSNDSYTGYRFGSGRRPRRK